MLEKFLAFGGHAAFLELLLPLKVRAGVRAKGISYPCPVCWGLVSSDIGMGKVFYELELKSFGSVCMDFLVFCDILMPKV